MIKLAAVILTMSLSGCTTLNARNPDAGINNHLEFNLEKLPAIDEVLAYQTALCQLDKVARLTIIHNDSINEGHSQRFNRLLAASCEADANSNVLEKDLKLLMAWPQWPPVYKDFLGQSKRHLEAIQRIQQTSNQAQKALEVKLKALSEIEETMSQEP